MVTRAAMAMPIIPPTGNPPALVSRTPTLDLKFSAANPSSFSYHGDNEN
jgi:hypothetical protein